MESQILNMLIHQMLIGGFKEDILLLQSNITKKEEYSVLKLKKVMKIHGKAITISEIKA